jgi:hypothetical protein
MWVDLFICHGFRVDFLFSTSIHLHPNGTQLLIGQKGGTAYLISHQSNENKGTLEKKYCPKTDEESEGTLGAIFATGGQAVVSGISNGCVLVWDRKKGNMVYGLKHGIGNVNNFSKFEQ